MRILAGLYVEVILGTGRDRFVGGAARDSVVSGEDWRSFSFCKAGGVRFSGGPGADVLRGAEFADVLVGGRGHDVARGAGGADTCRAEIRHSCER